MNFSKTSNPVFSNNVFAQSYSGTAQGVMTMQGTINKSLLLLGIIVVAASFTWNMAMQANTTAYTLMIAGAIVGFVLAMVTVFKKDWAHVTAPLYAVCQGLFLGGVSAFIQMAVVAPRIAQGEVAPAMGGIVFQAVALTFAVFFIMFLLYRNRIIQPTQKFMMGVVAATGAVALLYIINLVMGFFGSSLTFLHSPTPLGIGISVVIVIIAALNLILDFKNIEDGVAQQAPKKMEWFAAFGLMVTLVWLYIEILRLLTLLTNRN
ncbi:MAG: Bax inhibitor-1/YccA family protein [Bacteroidales bacterium]|jgi:uncharacterized YccA/Bax inhibitor family protein|nr:Bax inhibitor-1/YccA family protein [Bacteroidales bacterium]